jgi:protein-S-isoprenylcysteine O-methyltransferase Ste14
VAFEKNPFGKGLLMKKFSDHFRRWSKLRFAILYPAAVCAIFFCVPDDASFRRGFLIMAVGMLIRLWSNCYAIKMGKLTTSGPYAFVRNPLYLGTGIIVVGAAVLLKAYVAGAVVFAVAAAVYFRTILSEQRRLTKNFGEAFLDYMKHVPAIIPRLTPYANGEKWPLSWQRLWESREHKVVIWAVIIVIAFHLKEEFLVEKETLGMRTILLIVGAFFLGALDIVADVIRHKLKKGAV